MIDDVLVDLKSILFDNCMAEHLFYQGIEAAIEEIRYHQHLKCDTNVLIYAIMSIFENNLRSTFELIEKLQEIEENEEV